MSMTMAIELEACRQNPCLSIDYVYTAEALLSGHCSNGSSYFTAMTLGLLCRDRAQEVAKAEIAELGRRKAREDIDLEYLKAVLLKGFESGELPSKSAMLPVIARLLHFSSAEIRSAQSPRKPLRLPPRK